MSDVAAFTVQLPLRCGAPSGTGLREVCGEVAVWQRTRPTWGGGHFVCDRHRLPGDEPIARDPVFRRVRVTLDVQIAGVSLLTQLSEQEAEDRVCRAIESIGGVVNLRVVNSAIGKCRPLARPSSDATDKGRATG